MWRLYFDLFEQVATRYFMVAGIFFLLYYIIRKNKLSYKKIQQKLPGKNDYSREISYSIITMAIFAVVPLCILDIPAIARTTTFYKKIEDHGWLYFFCAFPLMFFMHDAYFYWMHRLIHHKKLFKTIHLVHHKSTNPSPWAAYSFHPLEAIAEAGIFVVFLYTIPIHVLHILVFFFVMIVYNVYGHLGYEIYPRNFNRHWLGKWINTSISHNQHHQYFKGNYGLYFTIWDRAMGTMREDYDKQFDEVSSRIKIDTTAVKNEEERVLVQQ